MSERSITNIMIAYAADAVDVGGEAFQRTLDFSPASIEQVESILADYEDSLPRGTMERMLGRSPSQEQLWQLARIWGAYVGEVIRLTWGGTWTSLRGKHAGPDITLHVLDSVLYPPTRVYNRLLCGIEENVWLYFQVISRDLERQRARREEDGRR